jgi:hypothetical protein
VILPAFRDEGLLPPGDFEMTFAELRESSLVAGAEVGYPNWDAGWRAHLVDNLEILVKQLWQVGIEDVFIDGSFVEDKDHPNDIDGYFHCELADLASGRLAQALNLIDPHKVWTWSPSSRRPYRGYPKRQLPMWHQYRVELYPHFGQPCGIRDRYGNELEFPSAFRLSRRTGEPRGIVKLPRGDQP